MSLLNIEEGELLADSKYRAYISQVEKALRNFENTSEWADLISALGKLNKVLTTNVKYPVIPKRVTIGKRLAQCLHPALPSGVHLKTLETYDIIFKCIGTQRLAADIFTYCAGLFPLLGYAAMNVKPTLLTIYETHFVPMGKYIKPALTGMLLALLPGLEEGSEHFERTNHLLEDFVDATDPVFFYGCLWECVLSCAAVRLSAINFALAHYNKKKSMEDQIHMMGTNIDLLVQALCVSVQDTSVLVQRSALEFLLQGFPMHNSQLTRPDMSKLVTASIKVVLRRDMSLNRRLYAWILGTDSNGVPLQVSLPPTSPDSQSLTSLVTDGSSICSEPEMGYFNFYSKEFLVNGIKMCINECANCEPTKDGKSANLRPFRILISILDKPEIGSAVIEDVLMDIFRYMYRECAQAYEPLNEDRRGSVYARSSTISGLQKLGKKTEKDLKAQKNEEKVVNSEIIKTANLLFGSFEPYFIWDFIAKNFETVCQETAHRRNHMTTQSTIGDISVTELCKLVEFLLEKVSLETYMETQTEHLPELLRQILVALNAYCETLTDSEITSSLKLCSKILARTLPSMTPVGGAGEKEKEIRQDSKPAFIGVPSEAVVGEDGDADATPRPSVPTKQGSVDTDGILSESEQYVSAESDQNRDESDSASTSTEGPDDIEVNKKVKNLKDGDIHKVDSFSDFLQYGDKGNAEFQQKIKFSPQRSPLKMPSLGLSKEEHPPTLMQACVEGFQSLFSTLINARMIKDREIVPLLMTQLFHSQDPGQASCPDLDQFHSKDEEEESSNTPKSMFTGKLLKMPMEHVPMDVYEAFNCSCQLLVDFSSFPMYCTDFHRVMFNACKKGPDTNFPEWLQLLLLCCCFVENFEIQCTAVSTMLDLISLTRSVIGESNLTEHMKAGDKKEENEEEMRAHPEGTVSVVILPSLSLQHLKSINFHTKFYQIVAKRLWSYLGDETPGCHQKSVELLHQIHQVAPHSWICEDVIGNALVSDDITIKLDAHKKFAMMWHLLREYKKGNNPGIPVRTFDRSMLVMLDSLQSDIHPCRALTQTWLTQAVQRGDIARVMESILLILLHPDTARISIQHVSFHQPKKVRLSESSDESSTAEAKIYAISSEGGNIIYHVSNHGKPISKRTSEELRTYALTSITSDAGPATKTAKTKAETELHFEKVDPKDLNLRLNPFGSSHSLDRNIFDGYEPPKAVLPDFVKNAKRLDKETCKKEGIYFDDDDEEVHAGDGETEVVEAAEEAQEIHANGSKTTEKKIEETSQEVVEGILDELIDRAMKESSFEDSVFGESISTTSLNSQAKGFTNSSTTVAEDYMNVVDKISDTQSETDIDMIRGKQDRPETLPGIHPLHTHILLYTQKFDAQRTLYSLSCIKAILNTSPRLVTCAMATTNITTSTPHLAKLQNLLARHRRSVFGKNFFSDVPNDALSSQRSNMYLEIVISICLYFMRSYYPNLMMSKLDEQELNGNKEVQILSCEILTVLLSEIVNVTRDSGRGFSTYMGDLMQRCKVQKALLHCVLASVYNARKKNGSEGDSSNITEAIICFNEENMDANTNETFQIKLLKLLLVVIILEDQIKVAKAESDSSFVPPEWEKSKVFFQPSLSTVHYIQSKPVVYQGMLLSAILSALKQQHLCHLHRHWVTMVTSSLPYMGRSLGHTVVSVVNQVCRNLELLAQQYELGTHYRSGSYQPERVPADHLLTMLEGLTTICHYCLLDNQQQDISIGQPIPTNTNIVNDTATSGQVIMNLIHVFNPYGNAKEPSPAKEVTNSVSPVLEARRLLLSILPRVLAGLTNLWKAIHVSELKKAETGKDQPCWTMGGPKIVRQYILEFVSPISLHHGVNLLGAVAVVWNDRRQRSVANNKRVIPYTCDDQLLLVDLVSCIKVLPMDTLIQTVRQVIKQPPNTSSSHHKKRTPLEVSMLQFFYAYIQRTPSSQLVDTWPSLLMLIKDGLQLNLPPSGQFLLLAILNEFVQKISSFEERKDQRDLQDIAQKLLEACSLIAGSSLEQTTWLRRNLAVKPGPQVDVQSDVEETTTDQEDTSPPVVAENSKEPQHNYRQYSVQALVMLAELIASLLDVVYSSEEKDKVVPFLNATMLHVFPYLRNHSPHNLPSYRACSQILASLSGYQYTRKAWRKEAFELLLDPCFFQMDEACIGFWRTIIDNLMTHDKVTFKDLLTRVTVAPSASLNLFSSKEQEFEQRAQLLKRFSFTIFCSEVDQYQKNMPEIQERLSDSLRLPNVPSVQAQVFLCFRVLILRMSPQHLTSLWPTVITELVHVLMLIEQELTSDVEETNNSLKKKIRSQLARLANLDSSWALGNGISSHNNPSWLNLYLAACKLLDLALVLPTETLPQFQLYRWAFTGDPGSEEQIKKKFREQQHPTFVPHVIRVARLMNKKLGSEPPVLDQIPGRPLLRVPHIRSIKDLHAFFNTVAKNAQAAESFTTELAPMSTPKLLMPKSKSAPEMGTVNGHFIDSEKIGRTSRGSLQSAKQYIEAMIEGDFLEPLPRT